MQGVVRDTGEVFDALSERDGQLRSLIANSNTVFATTAARNRELEETFRALPTFERESTITLARLTKFAKDTNPLVTQLRPAARQLSPTLQDLSKLAPELKALFTNLNPLFDVAKAGLPATEDFLDELHPLLANFDAPLRQLNPPLIGLGPVQRRAQRLLRQHGGDHAGHDAGGQRARALPAHEQPGEPREPRRLSAPSPHQPPQSV